MTLELLRKSEDDLICRNHMFYIKKLIFKNFLSCCFCVFFKFFRNNYCKSSIGEKWIKFAEILLFLQCCVWVVARRKNSTNQRKTMFTAHRGLGFFSFILFTQHYSVICRTTTPLFSKFSLGKMRRESSQNFIPPSCLKGNSHCVSAKLKKQTKS